MTSLSKEIPEAAIWKSAELGQVLEDWVRRPAQVVYSEVPSRENHVRERENYIIYLIAHGCRTLRVMHDI